ncbi:hypothetical protein TEA_000799 [Camellia sinensis var. sinensis]|uniref:Ubiquitin-like domain-containing protein n=1 Tax=Camellia sinensis var. sinensis TaxID=542762 RepID=A0A4S4DS14_CAMSN|nr:hypothetical protein TEA_000799 [Camellia sinensis var. sinensis]
MADQHSIEGSGTTDVGGEIAESMVELNIKTLDSQIYSFQVDKNMPVSQFKEKIASEIGLPVGQQRLIFRGKVLKDDHQLSEYHVDNGHTLHLVARQPSEAQPHSSMSTGETSANNGNRGHDANAAGPHNRIGQVSHSVVLGTLNVGDQGEGIVPDITRIIGAVLNSIGVGGQTASNVTGGVQPTVQFNTPVQASQRNEAEGRQNNIGALGQSGSQTQPAQALPSQSLPQILQIPLGAAIPVPSLNTPIPDSLHTLSEFMNRMELALSQHGYQPNSSPTSIGDLSAVESARGLSTPEALIIVLRHAQRLLSGHTVAALSHIAGRLEQEGGSTDPMVRGQIQTESMQVGLAMQHLGALLLELGRTILTLRMGQSPAESYVNAGPAVYISPSGPNPIMVQPFPLQTNSLFGGSIAGPPNSGTSGAVGHSHATIVSAVGPRASNAEGVQGEPGNRTGSADSGQTRVLPLRNVIAAAVPSRLSVTTSSTSQTGVSVSQPPPDSVPLSTVISEVNSRIRNYVDNMRSENQAPSGRSEILTVQNPSIGSDAGNDEGNIQHRNLADNGAGEASPSVPGGVPERDGQKAHTECCQTSDDKVTESGVNSKDVSSTSSECAAPRSGCGNDNPEFATAVPLGLGLGALQPKMVGTQLAKDHLEALVERESGSGNFPDLAKGNWKRLDVLAQQAQIGRLAIERRSMQPRSLSKGSDATSSAPSQNQQTRTNGQQILQSLANMRNTNSTSSGQLPPALGRIMESVQMGGQGADGQFDAAGVMSQVLHSPALNGLLAGVSEQTGVGSSDALRNMLEQVTQSPAMRNTVNQMAQQFDNQDLGNMLSGFGRGQGGGIDLTSMVQQMMPIVSQALSGRSTIPQQLPVVRPDPQPQYNERNLSGVEKANDQDTQTELQEMVQRIEHQTPPEEIFRTIAESAAQVYDSGSDGEDLVNELCREEGLASVIILNLWRFFVTIFVSDFRVGTALQRSHNYPVLSWMVSDIIIIVLDGRVAGAQFYIAVDLDVFRHNTFGLQVGVQLC